MRPWWAFALAVAAVVFAFTILTRGQVLSTPDVFLHIGCGRWMIAHHQIPSHGVLSGSLPDAPWVAHEWLASVAMAEIYDHWGWDGLLAATAFLAAVAFGAVALETGRVIGPWGGLVAAVTAWGLGIPHLVARPHIAVLPLVVVWIAAHVTARRLGRHPPWLLVPVMALWANLHGSFLFGLGISIMMGGEAVLIDGIKEARRWALFIGAAALAAMATPHGPAGLLFPIALGGMGTALATVGEWQPSTIANNMPLFLWLAGLVFAAIHLRVRVPPIRLAIVLILLAMALAHRRHTELLGVAAPLLLADAIAARFALLAAGWRRISGPGALAGLATCGLAAVGLSSVLMVRDHGRGPVRYAPVAAVDRALAEGIGGPVFNAYNFGGYLVFRGIPPFIDGRLDMYGPAFVARYGRLDQLVPLLDQYGIVWTIFEPNDPRVALMDAMPGWHRLYADGAAVVHEKGL